MDEIPVFSFLGMDVPCCGEEDDSGGQETAGPSSEGNKE